MLCAATTEGLRTGRAEAVSVFPRVEVRRPVDAVVVLAAVFLATGTGCRRWADGIRSRSPSTAVADSRRFTDMMLAGITP